LALESASIGTRRQRGRTRLPLTTDSRRSCRELAVLLVVIVIVGGEVAINEVVVESNSRDVVDGGSEVPRPLLRRFSR
jgi:hypothetical protein